MENPPITKTTLIDNQTGVDTQPIVTPPVIAQATGSNKKTPIILIGMVVLLFVVLSFLLLIFFSKTNIYQENISTNDSNSIVGLKETKSFEFGNYQVTLPTGWNAIPVNNSIITDATSNDAVCMLEPVIDADKTPCIYTLVTKDSLPNVVIRITDTSKVGLGEGGSILTVTEKQTLGTANLKGAFTYSFLAKYVNVDISDELEKKLSESNEPELYWVTGCLKNDFCISMNNTIEANNTLSFQAFNEFVNQLQVVDNN